ncbi:BA75_04213T0 [Komagataella pastoris]|uniref:BA75_04213T0 n=1 Tax=Komagataella pastoris TaxID=4922 RepID=A0A1B2JF26_PICPA|nr:BA75_04213T0 [Komagataella pastoris]
MPVGLSLVIKEPWLGWPLTLLKIKGMDLSSAVGTALIGRKHFLVSCDNISDTISELQKILKRFNLKVSVCEITDATQWGDISTEFSPATETDVIILPQLVKGSSKLQNCLYQNMINSKILILPISLNIRGTELELHERLKDIIWYRYFHSSLKPIPREAPDLLVDDKELNSLRNQLKTVQIVTDIRRYMLDIIVYTRTHRMVVGGLPTYVIDDFELFCKCQSLLRGYDYVIPIIVKLSALWLLPFKIKILNKVNLEPSLQWGSDYELVKEVCSRMSDANVIIEEVVANVGPPL